MANEQNLKPRKLTSEEAVRMGKKGGQASAEARRKRKALKESMNALLELPVSNKRDLNKLTRLGIDVEDMDNSVVVVVALYEAAKAGDVAAIKELRNLIGEDKDTGDEEGVVIVDDYKIK